MADRPGLTMRKRSVSYYFFAPARLAARKEIPARIAFC